MLLLPLFLFLPHANSSQRVNLNVYSPKIGIVGRFDARDPKGPKFSWPASTIEIKMVGRSIHLSFEESGSDDWQSEVDGVPDKVLNFQKGTNPVDFSFSKEAAHTLRLVKRTEAFVGTTQLRSVQLEGKALDFKPKPRRIEVIGDSISCGYGDEAPSSFDWKPKAGFSAHEESAYSAYGQVAARQVGAESTDIAWSGRKLWPDNTIPEIYDLAVPTDSTSKWSFSAPPPQAFIINLGTNDFSRANPEEGPWTTAYEVFIRRLELQSPQAQIYCALGSMMSDYDPKRKSFSVIKGYLTRMVARLNDQGDRKVHFLEFDQQQAADGIGADYHPSNATQRKMAAKLVEALKKDLAW